jgi:hypothetical protein
MFDACLGEEGGFLIRAGSQRQSTIGYRQTGSGRQKHHKSD